jgi:hypothetical protein
MRKGEPVVLRGKVVHADGEPRIARINIWGYDV